MATGNININVKAIMSNYFPEPPPKKVEKLTEAQIAAMPRYVDEWLRIGLSTEPADRPAAERAIAQVYAAGGLRPPVRIVWCSSPMSGVLTRAVFTGMIGPVGDNVRDNVWDNVWANVGANVGANVRANVWANVGANVWANVGANVRDNVRDNVWDNVWANVGANLPSAGDLLAGTCWGNSEAGGLACYDFFRRECGLVAETEMIQGYSELARHAGWFWPHARVCFVAERHNILHQDARSRLHCEDGPAVAYPDGWGVWAWHGVRVPQAVIEQPHTITVKQIEEERNAEVRRVMMERFGTARFIQESGAELIHADEFGELYRRLIAGDEPLVMVKVVNSTPEPDGSFKDYWLRVPPGVQTAHEAVAWTFGVDKRDYKPRYQS